MGLTGFQLPGPRISYTKNKSSTVKKGGTKSGPGQVPHNWQVKLALWHSPCTCTLVLKLALITELAGAQFHHACCHVAAKAGVYSGSGESWDDTEFHSHITNSAPAQHSNNWFLSLLYSCSEILSVACSISSRASKYPHQKAHFNHCYVSSPSAALAEKQEQTGQESWNIHKLQRRDWGIQQEIFVLFVYRHSFCCLYWQDTKSPKILRKNNLQLIKRRKTDKHLRKLLTVSAGMGTQMDNTDRNQFTHDAHRSGKWSVCLWWHKVTGLSYKQTGCKNRSEPAYKTPAASAHFQPSCTINISGCGRQNWKVCSVFLCVLQGLDFCNTQLSLDEEPDRLPLQHKCT